METFKKIYKKNAGVSVVEFLFAVFVLAVVGTAIAIFQKDFLSVSSIVSSGLDAQQEARTALKRMSAEIRPMSISNSGAYSLAEASSTSMTFYSNIDSDAAKERVRYFLQNSELKRGILKPTGSPLTYNPANEIITTMVRNIENGTTTIFSYYDSNYDGTSPALTQPVNILSVRLVKITVIIDRNASRPPAPVTMTTQVSLRNLKDNL